jgi:hypothetical protein
MLSHLCQGIQKRAKLDIPFYREYNKDDIYWKKDISCKNNIVFIRNLEIKFHDENCYNYNNITFICILQSYRSSMNETLVF